MSDSDFEAAVAASALSHEQSSAAWALESVFEVDRASILIPTCTHAPLPGIIRQVGTVNQFHASWRQAIETHCTSAAICGYMSVAVAEELALWPRFSSAADVVAFQAHLRSTDSLPRAVERAMSAVHSSRMAWVEAHAAHFPDSRSRLAYERAWVANYEVSDLLRQLPSAEALAFVRFNQYPERGAASEEELGRILVEEASFGGSLGSKSSAASYTSAGDTMFIVELCGYAAGASIGLGGEPGSRLARASTLGRSDCSSGTDGSRDAALEPTQSPTASIAPQVTSGDRLHNGSGTVSDVSSDPGTGSARLGLDMDAAQCGHSHASDSGSIADVPISERYYSCGGEAAQAPPLPTQPACELEPRPQESHWQPGAVLESAGIPPLAPLTLADSESLPPVARTQGSESSLRAPPPRPPPGGPLPVAPAATPSRTQTRRRGSAESSTQPEATCSPCLLRPEIALRLASAADFRCRIKAAVVDLDGHFAVVAPLRRHDSECSSSSDLIAGAGAPASERAGDGLDPSTSRTTAVLFNSTDLSYLTGAGASAVALAFDLFFGNAPRGTA